MANNKAIISQLRTEKRQLFKLIDKLKKDIEAMDIVIERLEKK